jgi:hypothetical protein
MAVQHVVRSDSLLLPDRAESSGQETVVLVAIALPGAAGHDLPAMVVEAAAQLFGWGTSSICSSWRAPR